MILASVSRGQDVLNILSGTGLPACHLHLCNVNSAKAKNAGLRKMAVPFMMRILFICSPLVVLGLHCNTGSPPVAARGAHSLVVVCGPLIVGASLAAERRLSGTRLSSHGSWGPELRLKSCDTWAQLRHSTRDPQTRDGTCVSWIGRQTL